MKIPVDSPEWLQEILEGLEDDAEKGVAKASTADEAMKASGAFLYFRKIKEAIEEEAEKQQMLLSERVAQLNQRT